MRLHTVTVKEPFERVVAQHGPTVLRVCRAVLGPVDADDAWSETFLAALRAYPDLPADANVEAWLVTIAHRKAIDVRARAPPATPSPSREVPDRVHAAAGPPTRPVGGASPRCPTSSGRPSPTTTSAGCPTTRSPRSSAAPPPPPAAPAADGIATLRRDLPTIDQEES